MTIERWKTFSKRDQLLMIGSEFERARVSEREGNREYLCGALERAISLIELAREDEKWDIDRSMLDGLHAATEDFIAHPDKTGVAVLYQAL